MGGGPRAPSWKAVRIGCNVKWNLGFCMVNMVQAACQAKHGAVAGITPADACKMVWPDDMKSNPSHLNCHAAGLDPTLLALGESIKDKAPETIKGCKVYNMKHLMPSYLGSSATSRIYNPERRYEKLFWSSQLPVNFTDSVKSTCHDLLGPEYPTTIDSGFCSIGKSQDCELLEGIRSSWKQDYGRDFCDEKKPAAGAYRCLALRKQIIRKAQAKSIFRTAMFTDFDSVVRVDKRSCPTQPKDAPPPPSPDDIEDEDAADEE